MEVPYMPECTLPASKHLSPVFEWMRGPEAKQGESALSLRKLESLEQPGVAKRHWSQLHRLGASATSHSVAQLLSHKQYQRPIWRQRCEGERRQYCQQRARLHLPLPQ